MKLNNKGFAITAVLYGLLILFVILVSSYLLVLSAKKDRIDELVNEIEDSYNSLSPSVGDYVLYTPTISSYKVDSSKTGYTEETQYIYPNELDLWRILNINNDGTIDIISEYVSSTEVYFADLVGYKNLVGYLNILASQYETEGITENSRHFGYNGQTEYITNIDLNEPWSCSTGDTNCNTVESEGGGDILYLKDYNQLYNVLKTRMAYTVGTNNAAKYWVASRLYDLNKDDYFMDRYIDTDGEIKDSHLVAGNKHWYSIRPIVTLKSNLQYIGDGTKDNPWQVIS